MAAYRRVYDSRHLQADCQVFGISSETLRSLIEYGLAFTPPYVGTLSDTAIRPSVSLSIPA